MTYNSQSGKTKSCTLVCQEKILSPTWRHHSKLCKFSQNISPNISHMKICTDMNLRESHCIFTFFHFPDKSHPLITPSEIATFCTPLLPSEFTLPSFGGERGWGYEYSLELSIVIVTGLVPRLFAVISFNIIII